MHILQTAVFNFLIIHCDFLSLTSKTKACASQIEILITGDGGAYMVNNGISVIA